MAMLVRMNNLIKENCQFVIATHSAILLSYPDAIIYEIGENDINEVQYEETDLYMTTKYFLNNYKTMHKKLF